MNRSIMQNIAKSLLFCILTAVTANAQQVAPLLVVTDAQPLAGVLVHASNAHEYKKKIPVELYAELRSGNIVMDVVSDLNYDFDYGADWLKEHSEDVELKDDGTLSVEGTLSKGFLFATDEIQPKTEKKRAIRKILWNVLALNWAYPVNRYGFIIRIQQEDEIFRELQGTALRLYNWRTSETDQTGQLFREVIEIEKPDILNGYAWLTFRFHGRSEDVVWTYSPVIGKARQLTGSNRSDLLAGAIAADDFLLWSGKLELVEGRRIREVEVFLPFASKNKGALKKVGPTCSGVAETMSAAHADQQMRWNFGSRKYAQGASWLPTDAVFTARKAFKIDLISRDPYSLYGRQTLYVDKESMLPVYKFVYDRAGKFWKSAAIFYGVAQGANGVSIPYPNQMVINDLKSKRTVMMDYLNVTYCETLPEGFDMSKFDPRNLGVPKKQRTPPKTDKKETTAEAKKSDVLDKVEPQKKEE